MEENLAEVRRGGGGTTSHAHGVTVGASDGTGLIDGADVDKHTPNSHSLVAQSLSTTQMLPPAHPVQTGPPQSKSVSRPL